MASETDLEIQQARYKQIIACRDRITDTIGVMLTPTRRMEIGKILEEFADKVREGK